MNRKNKVQFGATRCQNLRLKCTKFDFRWASAPDSAGELTALPRSLALFKGPTVLLMGETGKGRVGEEKGKGENKGKGKGGEEEVREGREEKGGKGR